MRFFWDKWLAMSLTLVLLMIPLAIWNPRAHVEGAAPSQGEVYLISIKGTIEPGLAAYVKRAIGEARERGAACILFEIDTFGGRVDAATEIRDAILALDIPSVAFVNERAWSAGALITLSAEHIAMAPGSSIGAAEPRPSEEKEISALRSEFESTAEARGRNPKIAGAMVDQSIAIEGIVEKGKLLTLTAKRALELGIADVIAESSEDALEHFGFGGSPTVAISPTYAERLARFVTDPTMSGILLVIGFLGLAAEVTTPGWGVPGTAGLIALLLFFGGRMLAGIAGFEVIILFIMGLVLLLLEVLVIPGFGAAGILGIASILGSLFLSFENIMEAINVITGSLLATVALGILLLRGFGSRVLREGSALGRVILRLEQDKEQGYVAPRSQEDYLGKVGRTLTVLRPAGSILIGEEKLDAISEGEFVQRNALVKVIRVEGGKLVVRPLEAEGETQGEKT